MLITSKGRYALRVMVDLAEHRSGSFIPVKEIAQRQEISQKYLERIMLQLAKVGLIEGAHGKGGGYRLTREPADYSAGEILRQAEGSLSCLGEGAQLDAREAAGRTAAVWRELDARVAGYLDNVTLESLMEGDAADDYVI